MNKVIDSMLDFTASELEKVETNAKTGWGKINALTEYKYGYMFTAENDGMALIFIEPLGDGWAWVEDVTNKTTVYLANGFLKGREFRQWFPVIKGHSYELGGKNAGIVKVATMYFSTLK